MDVDANLLFKLRNGFRMDKPKLASDEIFEIMFKCWNTNPSARPTFNELENILESFLEPDVKEVEKIVNRELT
jgi:hypothetical protein